MAYENLKTAIKQAIKNNNNQEITGDLLQSTLLNIVNTIGADYKFLGFATPSTVPPTSKESKLLYFASKAGKYVNFPTSTENAYITIGEGLYMFTKETNSNYWKEESLIAIVQELGNDKNTVISQKISSELIMCASSTKVDDKRRVISTPGWITDKGTINTSITTGKILSFTITNVDIIKELKLFETGAPNFSDTWASYAIYKSDGSLKFVSPMPNRAPDAVTQSLIYFTTIDVKKLSNTDVIKVSVNKICGGAVLCVRRTDGYQLVIEPDSYEEDNILTIENHWKGKKWIAYGTSITNTSDVGKYAKYLEKISGMIRTNRGFSGGGITTASDQTIYNAIVNSDSDGKLDADLITLECYANDGYASLGTIYDITGNSTFAAALNTCIRYLQSKTKAQIVVLQSPPSRYHYNNPDAKYNGTETIGPDNHTRSDATELMRKICELNNVYFINWSGLGLYRIKDNNLYVVDQIHHTELGGYIFAKGIWSYLKDIPLFETEIPNIYK